MSSQSNPRVLVAFKKSRWEHFADGDLALEEGHDSNQASIEKLKRAHRIHREGVEQVTGHLEKVGLDFESMYRGEVGETDAFDLIVTVGGDGTVLDLSHRVATVPILAINSHPESSVGYFCAGTVTSFPDLLERSLEGSLQSYSLARFSVRINGETRTPPVLNDVLVAHSNPAAVTHYELEIGRGPSEEQKSSGIWISTPAGSTAAIRSAGGFVLPLGCHCMEYLVREPYPMRDGNYRYRTGIEPMKRHFRILSKMQHGRVFIDGPHIVHDLSFDDVVELDPDTAPLRIYGLDVDRRTR